MLSRLLSNLQIDGLDELVPGMTIADFQSLYYISPVKYLWTVNKAGSWVDLPFYGSFMTDKDPGNLTIDTELVGWDNLGEFHTFEKLSIPVKFQPFLSAPVANQRVQMPETNGLYLLRIVLKNDKGQVLHRNFTTFRVKDGKDAVPENARLITFAPASFTAQEWSAKQTSIFGGLKVDGFGHGYFEYTIELPKDIDLEKVSSAQLVFEASAKQQFGKDKEGDEIQGDYMLGKGTFDPCKSPNSYAMTDNVLWPSKLEVSINGKVVGKHDLSDDPADHRGILSWGSQPDERHMSEAGSYGELVKMDIPFDQIPAEDILRDRNVTLRFTVPADDLDGGLAIYGKDFGRYPLDPTIILRF